MFPWEHITWMGFVTVITECRSEGTCLYREGAFSVSLKNQPRRVFTFNYFMEVSGRCITYFQRAQLWNIWENTVKKPAFFRNAGFFREKRDVFAKIAALNAALFDQTLRFFLPGNIVIINAERNIVLSNCFHLSTYFRREELLKFNISYHAANKERSDHSTDCFLWACRAQDCYVWSRTPRGQWFMSHQ